MKKLLYFFLSLLFLSQHIVAQVPSYVPTDGLVGYWPLNGEANDESENGCGDGVIYGATAGYDRFGNYPGSMLFDGIDDYIEISDVSAGIQGLTESISISAWFKVLTIGDQGQTIIARRNFTWTEKHHFEVSVHGTNPSNPDYSVSFSSLDSENTVPYDIQPFTGSNVYNLNNWNNITVVFNSNNGDFKFFINGNLVSTSNFAGRQLFPIDHWINIGAIRRTGGNPIFNFFNGELDDIGIWSRALTEQEVANLYASVLSTNPIIYESNFNIYPNPTKEYLNIDCSSLESVSIYNILGKELIKDNINRINVSSLSKGVYFIKVSDGINSSTKKFIKD
tara:strand:- start:136 stop:1143 length:1008 start_codon:yes stop_codon:yes gene_type:complete